MHRAILYILAFIVLGCKQKDTLTGVKKERNGEDSHYVIWKFAPNNLHTDYKDFSLYISEDSIKILNSGKLVCSGEIVKEKNTFASYFKSSKTGSEKKELLKKDFGIKGTDELLVVMNADGDISKKGCQFPFNDMFIVDGYLFFYKNGYHAFMTDNKIENNFTPKNTALHQESN